ncbi:MAG: sodium:proton antiporter [Akkermansiaceae bacterium]|nr:sodium:proton antiporter [Akkermansiaceae bacterium]MCP5551606.1 sodium:proton antiporter [Akkermansiaceae bacterium]
MTIFELAAILLSFAAILGYLNVRYLQLPATIGIMLISLIFSVGLILLGQVFPALTEAAKHIVGQIDFNETLLDVMLSYLLFAGALHVDLSDLSRQRWVITILATAGVVVSTVLIGTAVCFLLPLFGLQFPYLHCLLFGALISPTDPVAVLGILKKAGVPRSLEIKITGESLFNDGIGVVVFLALAGIAAGEHAFDLATVGHLFLVEAVGGVVFGAGVGFVGYHLLRRIDHYQTEVLITLALVTGGYSLAHALHTSGPLAMVVAGLMIGNHGRLFAMSDTTRHHLDLFWELVDEVLNALLFALIGLELLVISYSPKILLLGVLIVPVVVAARFLSVSLPIAILKPFRAFSPGAAKMLTWGGLRGGISVALALSLPEEAGRNTFLALTYVVVVFSIAVQGMTLRPLYDRFVRAPQRPTAKPADT